MHRRQRFSLLLCLVISLSTAAQDDGGMRVGYGFNIGVNHSLLSLQTAGVMEDGASLRTVNKSGLELGLQAQLDLGESIRLRPGVNLAFVNHSLRVGGASTMAWLGADPFDVRALGRCSNECYALYRAAFPMEARQLAWRATSVELGCSHPRRPHFRPPA